MRAGADDVVAAGAVEPAELLALDRPQVVVVLGPTPPLRIADDQVRAVPRAADRAVDVLPGDPWHAGRHRVGARHAVDVIEGDQRDRQAGHLQEGRRQGLVQVHAKPGARNAMLVQDAQRGLDTGHAPVAHVVGGQVHRIQAELALPLDDD